jgi:hypothetical protein
VYIPAMLLAVSDGEVALPLASVMTVGGELNIALAPVAGAANVTATPEIGLPPASVTVAVRGSANIAPVIALCGVPAVAVILAGTCITVTVSACDVAELLPSLAVAVFVTMAGEESGTSTVNINVGNWLLPSTALSTESVQVTLLDPTLALQSQFAGLLLKNASV